MKSVLDQVFSQPTSGPQPVKLMTHVVAGFPSFEANLKCIKAMEAAGTNMVEVQLPFSDPMADGPTIMKANQVALNNGVTLKQVFDFLKELTQTVKIPIFIMSYYNIPFRVGLEKFFEQAEKINISGLIIPDIPYDEMKESYLERVSKFDLHPILVVSPAIEDDRLERISQLASGMVYTTLRTGITGVKQQIQAESFDFVKRAKSKIQLPLAAGFGVSSPEQIEQLKGLVDVVVLGSKIVRFFEDHPVDDAIAKMSEFLISCKEVKI